LRFVPLQTDRVGYVWFGAVQIGGHALGPGSSFIAERDTAFTLVGGVDPAVVLIFAGSGSDGLGRHVHLLPSERVPRSPDLGGGSGVSGGIHADSDSPSSTVWLHENRFPGTPDGVRRDTEAGIHSHSEDEIIFVVEGQIRLGAKLYDAGTALQIAAETFYSFTPGPAGLGFINFRAAKPGDIKFANGNRLSETGYWRSKLPRPEYIEV
jgi:hypothetical protein